MVGLGTLFLFLDKMLRLSAPTFTIMPAQVTKMFKNGQNILNAKNLFKTKTTRID